MLVFWRYRDWSESFKPPKSLLTLPSRPFIGLDAPVLPGRSAPNISSPFPALTLPEHRLGLGGSSGKAAPQSRCHGALLMRRTYLSSLLFALLTSTSIAVTAAPAAPASVAQPVVASASADQGAKVNIIRRVQTRCKRSCPALAQVKRRRSSRIGTKTERLPR